MDARVKNAKTIANAAAKKKKQELYKNCATPPPKKPINPYLLFCQENRQPIQEKHTKLAGVEMNNQELTKALANKWHDLVPVEKQIFYDMYEREKERYEQEMKIFTEAQKVAAEKEKQLTAGTISNGTVLAIST